MLCFADDCDGESSNSASHSCVGDDDSGTDENGDTPPFSPTPPPTSGFLMAKKMKIGCSSEAPSQSSDPSGDQDDGLTHSSALAVMFASSVPTPDDLAQLKKKKKVRGNVGCRKSHRRAASCGFCRLCTSLSSSLLPSSSYIKSVKTQT